MDYRGPRDGKRRRRSSIERGRTYKRRYRIEFYDPDGKEHGGLPTYPWKMAPDHLLTTRQLLKLDLRPAQPPAAQVIWMRGGAEQVAFLYDRNKAKPKICPSLAVIFSLERAWQALRTCPICQRDVGYRVRRTYLGHCADCHEQLYPKGQPA